MADGRFMAQFPSTVTKCSYNYVGIVECVVNR